MMKRDEDNLIDETIDLVGRLLRDERRDVSDLREHGQRLLIKIHEQMREFGRQHGPCAVNRVSRAEYLLAEMFEHATLLGKAESP